VNARRFIWAVLFVALAAMLTMLYLQHRMQKGQPAPSQTPPATSTATDPAETQPVASQPVAQPVATRQEPASKPSTEPTTRPAETKGEPPNAEEQAAAKPATRPLEAQAQSRPAQGEGASPPEWVTRFEPHQRILGSADPRSGYKLQVELTSRGAAVEAIRLAEHFQTVADKRRYQRDPDTYEQAVKDEAGKDRPKLKGHYVLVRPVGTDQEKTYPLATERVYFPDEKYEHGTVGMWVDLSGSQWKADDEREKKDQRNIIHSVTFVSSIFRKDKDGKNVPFVDLEKTYTLAKDSYSLVVSLDVINRTGKNIRFAVRQFGPTGMQREDIRQDRRALAYGRYKKGELKVLKPAVGETAKMKLGLDEAERIGTTDETDKVLWMGLTNKFFACLAYPPKDPKEEAPNPRPGVEFSRAAIEDADGSRTYLPVMKMGVDKLDGGKSETLTLAVFAGPKQRGVFDGSKLYTALHYKDTLDFGSCCPMCTLPWLSLAMMWLLEVFSRAAFGNYGLAIIVLVILVRLAMHPLTKKSQVSMSRMQKLQPLIQKIREKYKDDKARLNQETMKLYKERGFSPMLGCLPMFLQFPIWIALWTGINAAVELRHAGLLPFWITDLAAPDALLSFKDTVIALPFIGSMIGPIVGFNLLPVLLCVAMALQQKLTPTTSANPDQAKQQKLMMYFMTGFFLLIFYNAPSGLTLYIMASTFAGVAEQYVIRKHIREKEAAEAAAETAVAMPGKHFRGQKPKKPKGPFQFMG